MAHQNRFFELDLLRGIAVVMMVAFNWLFALDYLGVSRTNVQEGFWFYFARVTAALFIIIAGISLALSASRNKPRTYYLKRGLAIFSFGIAITITTRLFLGDTYVRFGILHLIGLSIILAYPLAKMRLKSLFAGTALVAAGLYLQTLRFDTRALLWLGFVPRNLASVDYFPLMPWFGVFLIGVFFGNSLYENGVRKYKIPDISGFFAAKFFAFLGRNSLPIYLLHQPALIALLSLLGIPFGLLLL